MVTMVAEDEEEQVSDNDVPEIVHNRLLGAVSNLYKQKRVKAPVRKEISLQVSEFHLTDVKPEDKKNGKIKLSELTRVLDKRGGHTKINEQIKSAKRKTRKLPKPLDKPQAERLERSIGYDNLKKDLSKWDPIVYHQRVAEQVRFPLEAPKISVHKDPNNFLTTFKVPTELEIQLAESLNSSELLKKDKEEEELEDFKLSLEEIKERRSIMARLRAQLTYKEAKAARQNKIKSKKFHRIQRKDKIKMQIKEFEELQKSDPEAALKKLEQLEKARAQERASLRHRTTGQWARNLAVRAKYDKDARIALSEQLAKSRELTQKLKADSNSEDENLSEDDEGKDVVNDADNSWLSKVPANEVQQFYDNYMKYEKEKRNESVEKTSTELFKGINKSLCVSNSEIEANEISSKLHNATEHSVSAANCDNKHVVSENIKNDKNDATIRILKRFTSKVSKNDATVDEINHASVKSSPVEIEFSVLHRKPVKVLSSKDNVANKLLKNEAIKRKLPVKSGPWFVTDIKPIKVVEDNDSSKSKRKRKQQKTLTDSNDFNTSVSTKQPDFDDMFLEVEENLNNKVENKINKLKSIINTGKSHDQNNISDLDDNNGDDTRDDNSYLKMKKNRTQIEIDEELMETPSSSNDKIHVSENSNQKAVNHSSAILKTSIDLGVAKKSTNIEPNNFFNAKTKRLNSEVPSNFANAEDNLDDLDEESKTNEKSMTISEAFACDDVDEEFKQEKDEEIKKSQVEDVNMVLPGWGSWGGPNVHVSKRKNRRFIIKFPKQMPRRDENKGNIVINEDKDEKIKPHLVTELPFPFTSVRDYEASIRAPVGRTWLPQSAHRKLIAAPVTTKLGTVIEPMTKDQILKNKGDWK